MNSNKPIRKELASVLDAVANLPPAALVALLDMMHDGSPEDELESGSKLIEAFLDEMTPTLTREFMTLKRFSRPAARVVVYQRSEGEERREGKVRLWDIAETAYAPPAFFPRGLEDLRDYMDAQLRGVAPERSLSIWAKSFSSADDEEGFFLFMRDGAGMETLCVIVQGQLARAAMPRARRDEMLSGLLEGTARKSTAAARIAREHMLTEAARIDLNAALKESGNRPLTARQWEAASDWLSTAPHTRDAFIAYAIPHASQSLTEAHLLLHMLTTGLSDIVEGLDAAKKEAVAHLERQQDRKLTKLRSDVQTGKTITAGILKRAERAEAELKAARAQLHAAKRNGTIPSDTSGEATQPALSQEEAIALTLDELFA